MPKQEVAQDGRSHGGDRDEQIIESYALLAIFKPTLHQLIEKPPLAQIY